MPAEIDIDALKIFTKSRTNETEYWQKIKNSQSKLKIYRTFAVNSSVHLVKKFEWQLIFCLNALIFISQTHMQKFSPYFPAVFF